MGVAVLFQSDNINTLDGDSEFRLTVMAGVAQDEVRKLSERLKFGFRQSIKNGRVLGNDKLYGYDKEKCVLTVNEEEAWVVRMIFELYANERLGLRKISFHLLEHGVTSSQGNAFTTTTIKNILLNPKYKGWYCANKYKSLDYKTKQCAKLDESEWVMYPDPSVPAIVNEELWDRANTQLKQRGESYRQSGAVNTGTYSYSSKLICGEHDTTFHRQSLKTKTGTREYWQCKVYRAQGLAGCSAPQMRTEELDEIMVDIFNDLYSDKSRLVSQTLALIQSVELPEEDHTKEIALLRRKKEKLLELSLDDLISKQEFQQRNEELNRQLEALESREKKAAQGIDVPRIKALLERELSFQAPINSSLAASIVDKIIVHNTGDRQRAKLDVHLKMGQLVPAEYGKNATVLCCKNS